MNIEEMNNDCEMHPSGTPAVGFANVLRLACAILLINI